jgi:hypothetical protein
MICWEGNRHNGCRSRSPNLTDDKKAVGIHLPPMNQESEVTEKLSDGKHLRRFCFQQIGFVGLFPG